MDNVAEKHEATGRSLAAQSAGSLPAVTSDANNLMGAIIACASNKDVDADKVERLLGMYKSIKADNAKSAYFAALSDMQDELPAIQERGEIKISDKKNNPKYALWEDINKAIKPIMRKHGFALSFRTGQAEGKISVTGILSHRDGHSEETTMNLPVDTGPGRNAVQAVGSSTSYGKRYTAAALLNITSTGDDDDGQAAAANGFITEDQVTTITDLLDRTGGDPERFCEKVMKTDCIAHIKASDYTKAITTINEADQARRAKARAEAK